MDTTAEFETIEVDRYTQLNYFLIYEPRWYDRKVLLSDKKIGKYNKVVITAADKDGKRYFPDLYITGPNAKKYKKGTNGVIACREVPLGAFKILKISERSLHDY